jgi:hypothetical protein
MIANGVIGGKERAANRLCKALSRLAELSYTRKSACASPWVRIAVQWAGMSGVWINLKITVER